MECIARDPDNVDSWFDLAFCLRHLKKEAVSEGILFNFDYVIHYYKHLGLHGCSYRVLNNLVLMVANKKTAEPDA